MTEALEYLKTLPVIYLNLDRAESRKQSFEQYAVPLFKMAIRYPALDGTTVPDESAQRFRDAWANTCETRRAELSSINKPPGEKFLVDRMKATLAIYSSHIGAIRYGAQYFERFLIAEDDIFPKSALFKESVPLPRLDNHISIWSGGLPMAALKTDDDAYAAGTPLEWRELPIDKNAHNVLGAGLVEYSRDAGLYLAEQVSLNPMPFDHAWGFAIKNLAGQRLFPTGFGQMGTSIRNGKSRNQILERTV